MKTRLYRRTQSGDLVRVERVLELHVDPRAGKDAAVVNRLWRA